MNSYSLTRLSFIIRCRSSGEVRLVMWDVAVHIAVRHVPKGTPNSEVNNEDIVDY